MRSNPTGEGPEHVVHRARRAVVAAFTTHEFEVWVSWLGFAVGVGSALRPADLSPTSLADVYPNGFLRAWGVLLAAGGVLKFTGLVRGNYRLRQVGLTLLGGCTAVIAVSLLALMVRGDPSRAFGVGTYGLFTAACISRFRSLGRLADAERNALRAIADVGAGTRRRPPRRTHRGRRPI